MSAHLKKLIRQVTADKKKFGLMVSLMAVMLLLWGRLLLKQVPRTAVADPAQVTADVDAEEPTGAMTVIAVERQTVYVDLPDGIDRDPFRFDRDRYPRLAGDEDELVEEKSPSETPDEYLRIEAARELASRLELQGAILGDTPRALINGRVYRIGDKVSGFVVTKVAPRQAVLENDGIEIHLEMGE